MRVRHMALFALLLAVPVAIGQESSVPAKIRAMLGRKGPASGKYGVHVVDAKTGEVIFEASPATPRMPASTMKIVTTAAALPSVKGLRGLTFSTIFGLLAVSIASIAAPVDDPQLSIPIFADTSPSISTREISLRAV